MKTAYDGEADGIFDINITPFVDVLLVLLVIFMVTAPIMVKQSLNVNLPSSKTSDSTEPSTLSVAVTSQGSYLLNGSLTDLGTLKQSAAEAFQKNADTQVVFAADLESKHKYIVDAMDALRQSGITKFAFQVLKQE